MFADGGMAVGKEKRSLPGDFYKEASEVLGEDFWQEIRELLPVSGPRIDMYKTSGAIVVLAELPGLQAEDQVQIRLEGQTLLLQGEIPRLYPVAEDRILLKERFFGQFERSLALPGPVSEEGVAAKYAKGLLVIELPLAASAKQTNIPIRY